MNMVANFNLTWKAACLEILQYVRSVFGWAYYHSTDARVLM